MVFCSKCGAEIKGEDDLYCSRCGKKVRDLADMQKITPAPLSVPTERKGITITDWIIIIIAALLIAAIAFILGVFFRFLEI